MGLWTRLCSFFLPEKPYFPICDLPIHLQEQILTKMEARSHYRMRQTCKYIENLAYNNRNIRIFLDKEVALCWKYDVHRGIFILSFLRIMEDDIDPFLFIEPNFTDLCPFGLRFQRIALVMRSQDMANCFDLICTLLKKHRISCGTLAFREGSATTGQCSTLLNVLKPHSVKLDPEDRHLIDAFASSTTLKAVLFQDFNPDPDVILPMLKRLLAIEHLSVIMATDTFADRDDLNTILNGLVTFLHSEGRPLSPEPKFCQLQMVIGHNLIKWIEMYHYVNPTVMGSKETRIVAQNLHAFKDPRTSIFERNKLTTVRGYSVHIRTDPEQVMERSTDSTFNPGILSWC